MKQLLPIVGTLLLLALAAFCVFGFMATFEPTDQPDEFMAFRVGYAVVGIACIGGAVAFQKSGGNR